MNKVKYSTTVLEAIEVMKEKDTKLYSKRESNTVFATTKDKLIRPTEHTVCYGSSKQSLHRYSDFLICSVQQDGLVEKGRDKKGDVPKFLDWMFNHGPYADAYVTKSGQQAIDDEWFVIDCTKPNNIVLGAAMGARCVSEHHQVVTTFNDLVELGVNDRLAFMLGHMIQGGRGRRGVVDWNAGYAEAKVLQPDFFGKDEVLNLIANTPTYTGPAFNVDNDYKRVQSMWGSRGGSVENPLRKFLHSNFDVKAILNPTVSSSKCLNPFKRKKAEHQKNQYEYGDNIKAMAMFVTNIEREFLS